MTSWEVLRRELGTAAFDLGVRGMARVARMVPVTDPARRGVSVVRDVAYGDHAATRLDVYRRADARAPQPALVYAHGGGFCRLSKDIYWFVALTLARHGFTVFHVDYRLAPSHRFPAAHADLADAVRWVATHARRYGADAERMLLAGDSSGANMVASVVISASVRRREPWARAVFDAGVRVRGMALGCGFLEIRRAERFAGDGLPSWVFDALTGVAPAYLAARDDDVALADPLTWLEGDEPAERPLPPTLLAVGTRDPLRDDTRRAEAALRRRGARVEARYYDGGVHGFHYLLPWQRRAAACWNDHARFLHAVSR